MQAALDSALELARRHGDPPVWAFAASVTLQDERDLVRLQPDGAESRVAGAIERARAAGADSLLVVTDGELTDREAGRRLADRLGVAVTEVRVAEVVERVGILDVTTPRTVTVGDTFDVRAAIVSTGAPGDSVRVTLAFGTERVSAVVDVPAAGRSTEATFRVAAGVGSDSAEWRPLDVRLQGQQEPWDSATRSRTWVRVTPEPTGAVVISLRPDWETRYLLPVLERSTPGGARAFVRVGDDSWVQAGPRPRAGVSESRVRSAAASAHLLVLQGDPGDLPSWLAARAARQRAVLYLVTGTGQVPGTGLAAVARVPGEWYAGVPPPPGPISAHLLGTDAKDLPPLTSLYELAGARVETVLSGRRDRRGTRLPLAVIGSGGSRRWAVVGGEGTWRWAARGGEGLELYRGLYSGVAGWLVQRTSLRPVEATAVHWRAGDSMRWRVAPQVRDLALHLTDSTGALVWADTIVEPGLRAAGPPLEGGPARYEATGSVAGVPFRVAAPLHGNAHRELVPRSAGRPLDAAGGRRSSSRSLPGREPPVWPLAAAIALLCVEWLWRRKVGLR
jgi:hypothetical protein